MIALVIVADGDRQRFVDTFSDLIQHAPMGELNPKQIVDASGDPEFRSWLDAKYSGVFQVVDLADYPTRPSRVELRVPAGALLDGAIGFVR